MGEPLFDLDALLAKASDPNFTAGLGPVEYLRRLHEGEAMPTPDEQIAALRVELTALREEFAKERRPVYETLGNPSFSTSGAPPSRYLCTKCDHVFSVSDETCPTCALTARAARAEEERDVARDALERIYGETRDSGDDPGILCFSIYVTARAALETLGVLPTGATP